MSFAHLVDYSSQAELDAARSATQDKYRKIFSRQIEEGRRQGKSPLESMDFSVWHSRVATPEENQEYRWAFTPLGTQVRPWKKWGGGNKMGSAGARINAERVAKAEAQKSAPDPNVNPYTNKNLADHLGLGRFFSNIDAHVNDRQGKPLSPNPSWGFSQKTLNEAGARGADPRFAGDLGANVYGVSPNNSFSSISPFSFTGGLGYSSPINSFTDVSPFSFTGDLGDSSLTNFSSFSPDSFLGNMVSAGIGSQPRFAGIFAV